jgi:hypothetical protein
MGTVWHAINQWEPFMHAAVFTLWAIAGSLAYLLIFRLIQLIYALIYSAEDASKFVKAQSSYGIIFWIISLNEFFKKALIKIIGALLLFASTFVFFIYASNQLKIGISEAFPASAYLLALSFAVAILAMRLLVNGVSLLLPAFTRWYYA